MTARRNTKHDGPSEYSFPNAKASLPVFEGTMPVAVSSTGSIHE